jgi:copper transport protein
LRRLLVALLLAGIVLLPTRADAHALLSNSDPASGANLAHSPAKIVLTFTEQPDAALSSIRVLDTSGRALTQGKPQAVPGRPTALEVTAPSLSNGVYTVSWRTVSKVDGHLAAGAFSFGVGQTPSATAKSTTSGAPRPTVLAVLARWLYLSGLIAIVGVGFIALLLQVPRRRGQLAINAAWTVAAIGALGVTEAQRRAAHVPIGSLLSSSLGHSLELRMIPLLVAGVLLPFALRLAGLAALVAMLGEVDSGHAAASTHWEWFRVGTQWLHVASVGIWIGGLFGLVVMLGGLPPEERKRAARRYSAVALFALLAVTATGVLRAFDEIASWHQLFHTGFGQLIIIKVALLGVLAGLGAVNRYRNVGEADSRPHRLRRIGSTELVVATVVVIATALLVNLAPPRSAAAGSKSAPPKPVVVQAHDFATTVQLRLEVSPGTAGFNRFRLDASDFDTHKPITGANVSLRFTLPNRPDLGDSTLPLKESAPGDYKGDGANLSIDGTWRVNALVQEPTTSVEVAMTVTTRAPTQRIDVQHSPGIPDIYTLHLPDGRSVQSYLDPGKPGVLNEFHVTVLAAGGNEVTMDGVSVSVAGQSLTVRRLDPEGHFVADLPPSPAGSYSFDVSGTTSQGDTIRGVFTIPMK